MHHGMATEVRSAREDATAPLAQPAPCSLLLLGRSLPHLPLALHTLPPTPSSPWLTSKNEEKDDGELIDGMTQDVLHHGARDQRLIAAVGPTLQQRVCRRLCGQGQRGKGVHD